MSNITITNETVPATPSSGKSKIYIESTTKKIESVDDAGVVSKYVTEASDKVMVSSNDTTPGYLEDKIVVPATSGLAKSTLNDAGDEDVQIALDINSTTDKTTPVIADELLIGDTEDSNAIKKADIASIVNLADHDQLTNFTATEHFTMLDEDDMATNSDTQAATQQSIKAYVDALGGNPANTYTISPSGGDYTTIQAALDANTSGNELFIVYPGTYTNDTINFTANSQTVMTPSKGNNVIVTNAAQVVEAGDFTGCKIKNIRINFTPTTAINGIEVNDGSLSLDSCRLDLTTSSAIAGATQPALMAVTGTGALTTKFGEFTYQHTGNTTNGIKAMFNVPTGGTLDCLRPCESSMTNSGTAAATSLAIDSGTAVIRITNACNFVITDTAAAIVAGLGYIGGSGSDEFEYCKIKIVGGGANTCYGIYNGGTGSIRSMHNIIEVVSGTANYGFFTGASATTTSIADDIRAADKNSGTGIFIQASSNADGEFSLYKESDPNLILGNVTKEDIEGGRESSIVFKGKQSGGEETTLVKIVAQHDGTSDDQKGDFIIQTNDGTDGDSPTERLRIDSAGNVGIGTASPSHQLHSLTTGNIWAGYFQSNAAFPSYGVLIDAGTSAGDYALLVRDKASANLVAIDGVGKMGIGTVTPSYTLELARAGAYPQLGVSAYSNNNTYYPTATFSKSRGTTVGALAATSSGDYLGFFTFKGVNTSNAAANAAYIISQQDGAGGATYIPGRITFNTGTNDAGPVERMRIDSAGKVGIGTASPGIGANVSAQYLTLQNSDTTAAVDRPAILELSNTNDGNGVRATQIDAMSTANTSGTLITSIISVMDGATATHRGGKLRFQTKANGGAIADRLVINEAGNVGIGDTSPSQRLVVADSGAGTGDQIVSFEKTGTSANAASNYYMAFVSATTADGYIWNNGSSVLEILQASDVNLKTNIKDADYGLKEVMQLKPVLFDWKSEGAGRNVKGFIAQDVGKVLPKSVSKMPNGYLGLGDSEFIPILTKAIQEQQEIIEDLKKRLKKLEK